jgi:nuclear pore complex protein Nup98-Nup96
MGQPFGAPTQTNSFGAPPSTFGQQPQLFGQPQQPATSIFGAKPAAPSVQTAGFGGFGQTAAKPMFGFGATTSTPAFGQPPQAQPLNTFGVNPQPSVVNTSFPSFGAAAPAQQPATSFGQPPAAAGSFFNPAAPAANMFGQATAPAKPAFSFGTGIATTPAPNTMFGQPVAAAPANIFGQQPQQNVQPNLFGQTAPTNSLFGKPAMPTTTLGAPAPNSLNMFGQVAAKPATFNFAPQSTTVAPSLFGQTAATSNMFAPAPQPSTMFGQPVAGTQPQLQASLDVNPYGISSLFNKSTVGTPSKPAFNTTVSSEKKATVTPSFKAAPRSVATIKLRGTAPVHVGPGLGESAKGIRDGSPKDVFSLGLDSRFTPRRSVKRLVINEHVPVPVTPSVKSSVQVDPGLEENAINLMTPQKKVDIMVKSKTPQILKFIESPSKNLSVGSPQPNLPSGYIMSPPLEELMVMFDHELKSLHNFKISVEGVGSIVFRKSVDLLHDFNDRSKIRDIPGKIVIIEHKCATVYPDTVPKPPVGFGLNVPATVTLFNCWPLDKSTKEPIKDPNDARVDRHIQRLRIMNNTKFLGFNINQGTWKFEVEHFR